MTSIPRLRFAEIAPGGAFHAALLTVQNRRGYQIAAHTHDFYEIAFVLAGEASHTVNGVRTTMSSGQIAFIRPDDCHAISIAPRRKLHKINVAFPADAWNQFRVMTALDSAWETAATPPIVSLPVERCDACARVFHDALYDFQTHPSPLQWLNLCRFLTGAMPFFLPETKRTDADTTLPPRLREVCREMRRNPQNLQVGLERFVEISGISRAHLARTLKAATGQTPTAFVNDLRLTRAALLLTTTALPILEIAADCGFAQLSHFYRLFQQRYQIPPQAYRRRAQRSLEP